MKLCSDSGVDNCSIPFPIDLSPASTLNDTVLRFSTLRLGPHAAEFFDSVLISPKVALKNFLDVIEIDIISVIVCCDECDYISPLDRDFAEEKCLSFILENTEDFFLARLMEIWQKKTA